MGNSNFGKLESIYQFAMPSDLTGKLRLGFGVVNAKADVVTSVLNIFYDNNAVGALTFAGMKSELENQMQKASEEDKAQLRDVICILSTGGVINGLEPQTALLYDQSKHALSSTTITDLSSTIGNSLIPENSGKVVTAIMSRSPFIHPSKRNTNDIDMFINAMPPLFLAKMSPYLDVEFQVSKSVDSTRVDSPSQLRFLMGAKDVNSLSASDKILNNCTHIRGKDGSASQYAGMEMFTSPQSLVNMSNLTSGRDRYVDVLDPFRPFASLENFTIEVTPAVGTFCYKKAKASIKIHDRSRLSEFSELINPRGYKDVTLWVTYGWIVANSDNDDEYSTFVNKKMLMREAYGIVNTSFTLDPAGQTVVSLDLWTKGSQQFHTTSIETADTNTTQLMKKLQAIGEEITRYRSMTLKDPPTGLGVDMRIYQLLDASQSGEFPKFDAKDIDTINSLQKSLSTAKGVDNAAVNKLVSLLKEYYKSSDKKHLDYQEQVTSTVTNSVNVKFEECFTGVDTFIPTKEKLATNSVSPELVAEIEKYNSEPQAKSLTSYKKKLVSFGKLFCTFIVPAISASLSNSMKEIQVFFYAMNEQCGPISLHSVAEFPLDMQVFMDQFKDHVISRGGEKIDLSEFMQLVINAQFLDKRAVGYGLRSVYEPYDKDDHDAKVKNNAQQEFENRVSAMISRYGGFKLPNIELFVEVLKSKDDASSTSAIFDNINTSAKDYVDGSIMRIHIYDKQLTPYRDAGTVLVGKENTFTQVYRKDATQIVDKRFSRRTISDIDVTGGNLAPGEYDGYTIGKGNRTLVRDFIGSTMPRFIFGANGTTIWNASLASKADPLMSTVNMMKQEKTKNIVTSHNGGGVYDLPLQVVPASLTLTTIGCPIAQMAQNYFIDFNTGTTLDNTYIVTGLTHSFTPGKYDSTWTLSYTDAYGKFISAPQILQQFSDLKLPDDGLSYE
jgi:hypothetical protein